MRVAARGVYGVIWGLGLCVASTATAQIRSTSDPTSFHPYSTAPEPAQQPASSQPMLQQVIATNETRGMDAAKQGLARGGYGFSSVGTPYGLYIMAVAPGSRAGTAGLRSGDVVLEVNGHSAIGMTTEQFLAIVRANRPSGLDLRRATGAPVHLPALAAQVAMSVAPPARPTAGCIGSSLADCLAHMGGAMRVDTSDIATQLKRAAEVDVNGKPVGGANLLTASAFFTDSSSPNSVIFDLDQSGNVSRVEISLAGNPNWAHTAEEYTNTGLGAAFRAVLPSSCLAADGDLAVFKFFENVVKPTIHFGKKDTTLDETHAETSTMSQSAALPFCGVKVRYSHLGGYDTNDISEDNEHGAYSFTTIDFTR